MPLEKLSTALTLAGLVVYAALFAAYQAFYGTIGLRPEDVGVGYGYLLVRSLAFLLLIAAPVVYFGSAVYAGRRGRDAAPLPARRRLAVLGMLNVAVVVSLWTILRQAGDPLPFGTRVGAFALGAFVVVLDVLTLASARLSEEFRGVPRSPRRAAFILLTAAMVFALAMAAAMTTGAASLARTAQSGQPVDRVTLLGLPLLDVEAAPTTIAWTGDPAQRPSSVFGPTPAMCGLLLGSNGHATFVLRQGARPGQTELVRLPSSSVATASAERCP